ncbi:MAG: hypothetical protein WAT92_12740 [Saprospiraceae bacterium]
MKFHPIILSLFFGTFLLIFTCCKQYLKVNISPHDIDTIELSDRFGNFTRTDSGAVIKTFKLDSTRYAEFINDISAAHKVGLSKVLVCYSINVKTRLGKELIIRGRDDLIAILQNDIYYRIDVDILKKYWNIDKEVFCKL